MTQTTNLADIAIRAAQRSDLPAIAHIYNESVRNTVSTLDTETRSAEQMAAWYEDHQPRYPIIVAVAGAEIAGWAALSRWSARGGYYYTAVASAYISAPYRGYGLGKKLLDALIAAGRAADFHTLLIVAGTHNEVSIRLAKSCGFVEIGVMREVGYKFDQWLDRCFLQKML